MGRAKLIKAHVPESASRTTQGEREESVLAGPSPSLQSAAKGGRKGRKKTCVSSIAPLIIWCKHHISRAFSLEQGRAACSLSAPVPGTQRLSPAGSALPGTAGAALLTVLVLCFLRVTSTPPGNRILKEFLCLISRFQTLFLTLLYLEAEPVDTPCSSGTGMHTVCVVSSCPSAPPFHLKLRVEDAWLGGWQLTRWCAPVAEERCCGKVTCQRSHTSRSVAELAQKPSVTGPSQLSETAHFLQPALRVSCFICHIA